MIRIPHSAVLLAIDLQQGFEEPSWPPRWNTQCDANGLALLAAWRGADRTILHVRHDSVEPGSSLRPDRPGNAFRPGFEPQAGEALAKVVDYYINTADLTQAGDLLEQILANHPDKPWLHKMLLHAARLAFRNKNFKKAQDYCSQILVGYPTSTSKPDALDLMKRVDAAMEEGKTKGGEGKTDKTDK